MSLAFGGTIFAQWYDNTEFYNPNEYETYFNTAYLWDLTEYEDTDYPSAYAMRDGELITLDHNWSDLEIGAFVDGVLRGFIFMTSEYTPDLLPMFEGIFVFRTVLGEHVTFKIYDHSTGQEYDCTTNFDVLTGDEDQAYYYGVYDYPDMENTLVVSFTTSNAQTFEKRILGYGENVNGRTGWYLIASPFEADPDNVTYMTEGNFDLYAFNQSGDAEGKEWINWENEIADYGGFTLYAGEGYLYARENDTTLVFTGEPTTETSVTVDLVYDASEGCEFSGVNLLGNPFGVSAYVDREFYVMNQDHNEIIQAEQGAEIPVLEGIFVVATEEGENVTFSTTPANNTPNPSLALNVVANEGNVIDRAVVSFGKERTLPKFQLNSNSTKVYIPQENRDYAVVTAEEMGEMPVSFKAEKNGSYSLNFTAKEVSFGYLHLIDNKTGKDVDLLENPVYSFDAQTTDYASRFKLVFATGNNSDDNFAFNSNDLWIISNDGEATLQVVDVTGRILSSETISGSCSKAISAAPGVYMLRLINGDNMKVQKVVVK